MRPVRQTLKNLEDVLNGKRVLPEMGKYSFICYSIAFIHIIISVRFFLLDYLYLYCYNFASVLFYLYMGRVLCKAQKYHTVYVCCFFEILFHSSLATLLAGWNWGFMIYTLALIPVAFYLAYSLPGFQKRLSTPFLYSFICMCSLVVTRALSVYITPIYTKKTFDTHLTLAYSFNSIVVFIMLIVFSTFFYIDIRHNELCLELQNKKLLAVSSVDPLTGLMNRRSMDECLQKALGDARRKGSRFSLILGDIDDFKKVNDTYGHNIGDQILIMVSDIITSLVPEGGTVCRWGGEEILILIDKSRKDAIPVAESMRRAIEEASADSDAGQIRVTMTFGLTEDIPGLPIEKLVSIADDNLYEGKRRGKNRVVY